MSTDTTALYPTMAAALQHDSRIETARRLIREAHAEYREQLDAPRPGKLSYDDLLGDFAALRGAPLFYRYLGSGLGNGALVELADGSVKYDFISGIGVHGWGHGSDLLLEAGLDAALGDTVMQGNLQQNPVSVDVSRLLLELTQPSRLAHVLLTTSGAMANENALKIAFQARAPANRVIGFEGNFCGRSLALAQVSDKPQYRDGLPQTLAVDYIPFYDANDPCGSTEHACAALEHVLARYPGQHAVFMAELIQGEGGYYPAPREFFVRLFERCRAANVLIHVDEIQTFGRTEEAFAFRHVDLAEYVDLVSVGKITQICATLFTDAISPRPGLVSQTFTGSTHALHAARAILTELSKPGVRVRGLSCCQALREHLVTLAVEHPDLATGPFGYGGMVAFTPYGGERDRVLDLARRLFDAGVIAFVCGASPMRLRFLPPIGVVSLHDVDAVAAILTRCLEEGA